jgi:hypothetical protein
MATPQEVHCVTSPTPDAYDGCWLELLENPDVSLPYGEPSGAAVDPAIDPGLSGCSHLD